MIRNLFDSLTDETTQGPLDYGPEDYKSALREFDVSVCEALAISQAVANILVDPHIGYGTRVFTRICCHATALMRSAPQSRWVRSDSEFWDLSAIAGHARAIIEGYLLLINLLEDIDNIEKSKLKINVMHLNDCTKRIQLMNASGDAEQAAKGTNMSNELQERIRSNTYFKKLDRKVQNQLLTGKYITVESRDEQLAKLNWDKTEFYALWDVLSHYTHILPLSFYSMETNGRGTGLVNSSDRGYITLFMQLCTDLMGKSNDKIVEAFPHAQAVRLGLDSKFAPGPRRNLPKHVKRRSKS